MTAVLHTSELTVRRHAREVLRDVSIQVAPGEVVGLLGPNGAGKSTLFKAVLGLVAMSRGEVTIAGRPAATMAAAERGLTVAYVPQEREAAWALNVEAIVGLGRLPHRPAFSAPSAADHKAVEQAMHEAGVAELRHRPVNEISGGERARVMMARALAQEAPLLLADEPASGLDPAHQLSLLAMLRNKADHGAAIVLSIHELHLAGRWCDRLILMHGGTIVASGRPETVLTRANMLSVYGCDVDILASDAGPIIIPKLTQPTREADTHADL